MDLYAKAGTTSLRDELLEAHPLPLSNKTFNTWMHQRVLTDSDLTEAATPRYLIGKQHWFQPDNVHLAFLPDTEGWLMRLPYWGALEQANWTLMSAAQHEWHERWGAELVASWGTMLQFVVSRPPAPGPDALALARQHLATAGSLQVTAWELALALPYSDAWFLHDRP